MLGAGQQGPGRPTRRQAQPVDPLCLASHHHHTAARRTRGRTSYHPPRGSSHSGPGASRPIQPAAGGATERLLEREYGPRSRNA
eukprot:10249-Eustigmatos_ZCMA.PRE.1